MGELLVAPWLRTHPLPRVVLTSSNKQAQLLSGTDPIQPQLRNAQGSCLLNPWDSEGASGVLRDFPPLLA
jgi:hypothetical protein